MRNSRTIALDVATEPYLWPGGYERWAFTDDGAVLCWKCCRDNVDTIGDSHPNSGWHVVDTSSADWADETVTCDHCDRTVVEIVDEDGV